MEIDCKPWPLIQAGFDDKIQSISSPKVVKSGYVVEITWSEI